MYIRTCIHVCIYGICICHSGGVANIFYVIVQQMLQAAANTAPIGVYVCGHTSTAAGLTVS